MLMVGRGARLPLAPLPSLHCLVAVALSWPGVAPCQPSDDTTAATDELEEIIVTARKVEEDLLRVPMSMQVLSGDFVALTKLNSLYEMQYDVPGLVVTSAGTFGANLALRGVTDQGGGSLSVAPHFNGVYLGRSDLALVRMFDVDRVEVLKGPQGTLYGRNATGGSINVFSRRPENGFSAAVESACGSFDTLRVNGHLNVPVNSAALRVAMTASDGDGFIRNSVDDRRFAAQDYFGVRAALRVQPHKALLFDLTAEHVEDNGATGELWLPRPEFLADPQDIRLTTVTLEDPYLETSSDRASAELGYEFSRAALYSISGYARSNVEDLDDCAGIPRLSGCVRGVNPSTYEQFSQELRLQSRGDTALEWLAGIFLFDAEEFTRYHFSAPLLAPGPINDYTARSRETAVAGFGQVTFRLSDRWSFTGGLRLNHERNRTEDTGTGLQDNSSTTVAEGSWNNTAWRADIQYAPADFALVYASIATGFKSGGITTERLPTGEFDSFDPEQLTAYEAGFNIRWPDRRLALRASAFVYDFRDMQVQTIALLANKVTAVIDNAAAARIKGVDVSGTKYFGERLSLAAGLVWMPEREFIEFTTASADESLSGNTLSRSPELSASIALDYRIPLRRFGILSIGTDFNYRSEFYFTADNDPSSAQNAFGLLNAFLRLTAADDAWYLFATGRNLTNVDYFTQVFIQSSPGYPANWEIGFGLRF